MWEYKQEHVAQDRLEFLEVAEPLGWTQLHTDKLIQCAKNKSDTTDVEQKRLCHLAGFLHPYEQTNRSIEGWMEALNGRRTTT